MRRFWLQALIPQALGRWLLAVWLIATGALALLGIHNTAVAVALNVLAIAAGALLLMNR